MATDDPSTPSIDLHGAQGVLIGDRGHQVNYFAPAPRPRRPWMSPPLSGSIIPRPNLYAALWQAVTRDDAGPTTLITAVEGAGGFGKTTLAAMLCQDLRAARYFSGGLLWITIGEHTRGARLAELISGLCEVLSGEGVTTTDPATAGGRLGELLDAQGPVLLVVDDVWRSDQLLPFVIGGRTCRRLVTTRNTGVAPRRGVSILVDSMTTEQAVATLTDGTGPLPTGLLTRLVAGTGRWPLLLSLVNGVLLDRLSDGADPTEAARWVLGRLEASGPAAFDVDPEDSGDRGQAVTATVEASLDLLGPDERERYFDLAILPEDVLLPADLLSRLWGTAASLPPDRAERLRARFIRLRLVLPRWQDGSPAVGLHDVLGSWLRHRLTSQELALRHGLLVRTAAELLPDPAGPDMPWWDLPAEPRYIWQRLPHHLAAAGRFAEREALVCDLSWVAAKSTRLGSSVPAETDLLDVPTDSARALRQSLGTITHLLTPGDPPSILQATLYGYLSGVPALEPLVTSYRSRLSSPQLTPAWPLPDQPRTGVVRVLTGHVNGVSDCAFSPEGTLLATSSHDGTVRLWDSATGGPVRILTGHVGAVAACAFSPDGTLLATTGHDRTARLWDTHTGTPVRTLTGHSGPVVDCAFSPDGTLLATASHDRTARLWDTRTGTPVRTLTGHDAETVACAFSPDGTLLATTGHDRTARLWHVHTGTRRILFDDHCETVTSCSFSPDGALLATSAHDHRIRLWETSTDMSRPQPSPRWEYTAAFSPDGATVATGGHDRTVRFWDVASGHLERRLEGHTDTVTSCAFSPDGTLLASASHDRTIRLWDARTGTIRTVLTAHEDAVTACRFSPDGRLLATGGRDDLVRIWDTTSWRLRHTLSGHTGAVSACAFSPDGSTVASAGHDHAVRIWESATGRLRTVLTGHTDLVSDCAFSPDGRFIASASHDRTAILWGAESGTPHHTLKRHSSGVAACTFTSDGFLITTDIVERRLRMWRPGTEEPWCGIRVVTPLLGLAWHPNRPLLCAVGESGVYLFRYLPHGVRDITK
ncbi:NB-ARC domain-containing protein [Kitasatospora sp. NPDC059722]|uniref:WD40 domain-containing protein n=1 Tax=Kitasatospora sp. NPDC059722 TaxID=3346925 RepID=UPI0036ADBAB1